MAPRTLLGYVKAFRTVGVVIPTAKELSKYRIISVKLEASVMRLSETTPSLDGKGERLLKGKRTVSSRPSA